MLRSVVVAALLVATAGCSAGTSDVVARDVGHGGIADVVKVLGEQGLTCAGAQGLEVDPFVSEERNRCTIDGSEVELFHFYTPEQAAKFKRSVLADGDHGAFADTWGARTKDRALAERLAAAVTATTSG
ncbi:MAG: hypothetical protein JWO60_917 [Frankiales bacterium]|nr:hypothetical protein [Frankiales bacterium]